VLLVIAVALGTFAAFAVVDLDCPPSSQHGALGLGGLGRSPSPLPAFDGDSGGPADPQANGTPLRYGRR
jgi:hypothetical protein